MADASTAREARTIDKTNVALFGASAEWWDPKGPSGLLHQINPARLRFLRAAAGAHFGWDARSRTPLLGARVLDIGCGGGILAEPLARLGGDVTGVDASLEAIEVARAHAGRAGLAIDYRHGDVESLALAEPASFDLVTAMEVVEHVADLDRFLAALRCLLKPSGLLVFSTPNRTAASFAVMIAGAEYLLRLIPRGAHQWRKFLRPEELSAALLKAGFVVGGIEGVVWRPGPGFTLGRDRSVNYIGSARPA